MATTPGPNPLLQLTPNQVNRSDSAQWKAVLKQALNDLRVATPAFTTTPIDPVTQTVTVQIALQEQVRTDTGPQWYDVPPIIMVPVVMPRGGGYSITIPVAKGDEGMLVFCDMCFDFWWVNGQNNAPVAANVLAEANSVEVPAVASGSQVQNEIRRHHIHDCGFFPGMWSKPNVLENYSTSSLQVRSDDGDTIIDVAEAGVTVTGDNVTVNASSALQITTPEANVNATSGTPLALVNDTWYQWYVAHIQPFLVGLGYAGPAIPATSETTVLKGQ